MISHVHVRKIMGNHSRQGRLLTKPAALLLCLILCFAPCWGAAAGKTADFEYTADFPYAIGARAETVPAGGGVQGRLCLLYTGNEELTAEISLQMPDGIRPVNLPAGWSFAPRGTGGLLTLAHKFAGGYENWFELLQFRTDSALAAGTYEMLLEIRAGEQFLKETLRLNVGGETKLGGGEVSIAEILLPYYEDEGKNRSLDSGVLLLRNAELDYYKNLFTGRGALSAAARTTSPLTHMRLEWLNPERQPRLILVQTRLLDKDSKEPVGGLISPENGADGENRDGGATTEIYPSVLAELDGSLQQTMVLPLYTDDTILKGGEYLLEVSALENGKVIAQIQTPVKFIALNARAALTTALTFFSVLIGLPYILARGRLQKMKSRHLITAGLFGTTAFAVVNVPGNFLNDVLHIFLGPFSFIVSGMFSGILLYMLIGSLVVLIPKFGIITLMLMVRMLINMLVFGHISPLALLIYGAQAVLLEAAFWSLKIMNRDMKSSRTVILAALACGIADMVSTYVILQSFSFLYRLYYAGWYIALCMAVSGFIYPAAGTVCGMYLGRELKKVGVD